MSDLSILIPAKNEKYLNRTVQNILDNMRGDTEILVALDGYEPEIPVIQDDRVCYIHNNKSKGQRQAINQLARMSTSKYIMKCDAHCAFDEGFDLKLMADYKFDWTVIPRMYQLDEESWTPKLKKKTDAMFILSPTAEKSPFQIAYYDKKTASRYPEAYRAYKEAEWRKGDISDTMASLGACFFLSRARFWELGGMDENHGHWGQMGVELGCKSWLSGGRQVVNKKTWFAHLWRRSAPWKMSFEQQEAARRYSRQLWLENKWPEQRHTFGWLVDKFAPVPSWNGEFKKEPKTSDITLLYYTANKVDPRLQEKVLSQLKYACPDAPVITVSQKPLDYGRNICIGDIGQTLQNIYKQVLMGAKYVRTEYVALVEDDTLYVPDHFNYRPPKNRFAYNLNRWNLHVDSGANIFSYRKRPILSQCIAPTKLLVECLSQREGIEVPKKYCGEMGIFESKLGLREYEYETFYSKEPNVVVCHEANTSGKKLQGKDVEPRTELAPWGNSQALVNAIYGIQQNEEKETEQMPRKSPYRNQHSFIASHIYTMEELVTDMPKLADQRRSGRAEQRLETLPVFVKVATDRYVKQGHIIKGSDFSDEELKGFSWYEYLKGLYPNWSEDHKNKRVLQIMRETVDLVEDLHRYGLKVPLDMWRTGKDKLTLVRGWRRFCVMAELHHRGIRKFNNVPARIFKSIEAYRHHVPRLSDVMGELEQNSIHQLAMNQFAELGPKATDKYWVHGYTKHYDEHFRHLRDKKIKLLEIGVFWGSSLLLWKHAFPKGRIYGVDKNTKMWQRYLRNQKRVKVFVGRQEDESFLQNEVVPSGPYNIIIDDGGHTPEQQLTTFQNLWRHVVPGGYYVVEDLHGNYWKRKARKGPVFMKEVKDKIDELIGSNVLSDIEALHCYYNIIFIQKTRG